jgi:protein-disulfide isomerase
MTLSGLVCAPQNPNTGDTGNNNTDNTDNDDTDTGSDNTGNNNGNTNTGGNNNNSGGNNVGPLPTQDEHVLGANSARVTVIEYVDFQCPFCGRFARNTFPTIKSEYVQTGKVKWILRHFPLRSIHPYAEIAAQATECANNQGSFWAYSDLVFEKQAELDALLTPGSTDVSAVTAQLKVYASDLSLNTTSFNSCLDGGSEASRVQRDLDRGTLNGACLDAANQNNPDCVFGTPTFFVNGDRQTFQTNDELTEMRGWLDAALDAAQ